MNLLGSVLDTVYETMTKLPHDTNLNGQSHHGATEDLFWQGIKVMSKGPTTNCVGFCTEVVLRCLRELGYESRISPQAAIEFRRWSFIIDLQMYTWGQPEAVVNLGWGRGIDSLHDVEKGDLAQFWHVHPTTGRLIAGHNVICLGPGTYKGKEGVRNLSSSPSLGRPGVDTHLLERTLSDGSERVWFVARLEEDLLP